jgi:hypothetical protein
MSRVCIEWDFGFICALILIVVECMTVQPESLPLEHMVTDIFERNFPSRYCDETLTFRSTTLFTTEVDVRGSTSQYMRTIGKMSWVCIDWDFGLYECATWIITVGTHGREPIWEVFPSGYRDEFFLPVAMHGHITSYL